MELTKKELETLLILLIGVADEPIPSLEHVKAEVFVLLRSNSEIKEILSSVDIEEK